MADRDLQVINSSGELTEIKLGGTGPEKIVLTEEQVKALFGNYTFNGDDLKHNTITVLKSKGAGNVVTLKDNNTKNEVVLRTTWLQITHFNVAGDNSKRSLISLQDNQAYYGILLDGVSTIVQIDSIKGITLVGQSIAQIDAGDGNMATTKEWVEGKFGNYSFDGDDLKHGSGNILNCISNGRFITLAESDGRNTLYLGTSQYQLRHFVTPGDNDNYSMVSLVDNQIYLYIVVAGVFMGFRIDSDLGILLVGQSIADIDAGGDTMVPTKEWVESKITNLASISLPDTAISAGTLRHMEIGTTYNFPTEKFETSPGSGVEIDVAKTHIIGIPKTNHHYVNACIIRTGVHTWIAEAEEYTGTDRQPTIVWYLDLDPAWPDHSGIGDIGARSFTSITTTIIEEIGDSTLLGSDNLVDRLVHEETERHSLSTRIATLEGGAAHQHVDVIQDFKLQVNNQGIHYMIVNDRPSNPDHIGKDLFDGTEHKVLLEWDTATPYSPGVPFDPANVTDGGDTANWVTGSKPNLWIQKSSAFKQLVDPTTSQVLGYAAISAFVDAGSILTVKWNLVELRLDVLKVQVPSVHVVTTPDHQPLQVGGTVDAKSVPFVSLNGLQVSAVKNNSLFLDDSQVLKWKNNSGVIQVVTLT